MQDVLSGKRGVAEGVYTARLEHGWGFRVDIGIYGDRTGYIGMYGDILEHNGIYRDIHGE